MGCFRARYESHITVPGALNVTIFDKIFENLVLKTLPNLEI